MVVASADRAESSVSCRRRALPPSAQTSDVVDKKKTAVVRHPPFKPQTPTRLLASPFSFPPSRPASLRPSSLDDFLNPLPFTSHVLFSRFGHRPSAITCRGRRLRVRTEDRAVHAPRKGVRCSRAEQTAAGRTRSAERARQAGSTEHGGLLPRQARESRGGGGERWGGGGDRATERSEVGVRRRSAGREAEPNEPRDSTSLSPRRRALPEGGAGGPAGGGGRGRLAGGSASAASVAAAEPCSCLTTIAGQATETLGGAEDGVGPTVDGVVAAAGRYGASPAIAGKLSDGLPGDGTERLRIVEFQRFLIALSVRPGSRLEISTQWLPSCSAGP